MAEVILNFNNKDGNQSNDNSSEGSQHSASLNSMHEQLFQSVKLPTITLPKFKGDYTSWLEFKDIFESLIHSNQSINKIQKFHYLRASLESDAIKVIQSLDFTSANYDIAWDLLCERFNNSKLLVHNHIKSIFDLEPLGRESSLALRNLIDNITKHLRALEALKQPVKEWDALLIFLISTKLDKGTNREWEKVKADLKDLKLDNLKDFLKSRADWLETIEINHGGKSNKDYQPKNTKHISLVSTDRKCYNCKESHLIYSCKDFLALTIPKRIEKINQLKLCNNCLCPGHNVSTCKSGPCKSCTGKHNTLIHQSESVSKLSNAAEKQVVMTSSSKQTTVLLSTVLLQVFDSKGVTPPNLIDTSTWNIPSALQLADPSFHIPSKVDILLGADYFWHYLILEQTKLGKHLPILQNTVFGWVVSGPTSLSNHIYQSLVSQHSSDENLSKFWELEEVSSNPLPFGIEAECEKLFRETVTRASDGRFVVRIPLKHPPCRLGDSKELAIKRMLQLERKFSIDANLKEKYLNFMSDYINLGHMTKLKSISDTINYYYLPHHGVMKESSMTTKLRVVFNGSAASTSGWSGNDLQFIGPPVHTELFSILLQFRQYAIAISADIEKMYRQILIHPDDRYLQTIIWRADPNEQLQSYSLNTVTYGTTSAPYLAIRCLKQLAIEIKDEHPKVSDLLSNHFYVDDLIVSFDSEDQAISLCKDLMHVLHTACFPIRKWASNCKSLLTHFENNDSLSVIKFPDDKQIRTLGVIWDSNSDIFSYQISDSGCISKITKRIILSEISRIFDPLGSLTPCVIVIKILVQKLWTLHLGWDNEIPPDLQKTWFKFKEQLSMLNKLQIPRHALIRSPVRIEVHGFCDASAGAYGAVIYLRNENDQGTICVRLLCAKSRVAPTKELTIPRLELCGALLLTRLFNKVVLSLNLKAEYFFWTDSQIVIHWLHTSSNKLNVFVSNRIAEIQQSTEATSWRYINTKENPADLASRGISPELLKNNLWWHGPHWLSLPSFNWPNQPLNLPFLDVPELKQSCMVSIQVQKLHFPFHNFSKLYRIQRVMAYCLRYLANSKLCKTKRQSGCLTVKELDAALKRLAKIAQIEDFDADIARLIEKKPLSSKSRLVSLSPFLDEDLILRVGGRLKYSSQTHDAKYPMLLNNKHHLTKLIIKQTHLALLHAGPQLVLSTERQTFWPIAGMNLVKKITRSCVTCFKSKPMSPTQFMTHLPKERVSAAHAFDVVGVDYAGPFLIKDKIGRGCKLVKAYISLYICFVTKAIHLELVTDLSTDTFLASLRRMIARRGKPSQIWSDNGTNFVGASHQLNELISFFKKFEHNLVDNCALEGITWKFIPPNSPHFGGLWKAGVKSVKSHLRKILKDVKLTHEEFYTVLTQIESILNSRPLCPLSSSPTDFQPLTPSHFLIGRPLTAIPESSLQHIPLNRLSKFQFIQRLQQGFWSRWSREYLSILQQRKKWATGTPNLKAGTLVIIKQPNLPPNHWMLDRISEVFPDSDGVVRVATVKTASGLYKRAVTNLCHLPLPEDPNSD